VSGLHVSGCSCFDSAAVALGRERTQPAMCTSPASHRQLPSPDSEESDLNLSRLFPWSPSLPFLLLLLLVRSAPAARHKGGCWPSPRDWSTPPVTWGGSCSSLALNIASQNQLSYVSWVDIRLLVFSPADLPLLPGQRKQQWTC